MKVEKSVLSALRVHFETYLKSPQFTRVVAKVIYIYMCVCV